MVVDTSGLKSCDTKPQPLFEGLEYLLWDVSPKGDFFVTLERREPPRLRMVLNWLEELKQRVPVN